MVRFDAQEIVSTFGLRNVSIVRDELICSCPFTENHKRGDARPSFGISLDSGLAHCFSCGYGGNLATMARDLVGMSFLEAQRKFYGDITPEEITRMISSEYGEKRAMTPLEMDLSKWCPQIHPYWIERGFTEESIRRWNLGFDKIANRVVVPIYYNKTLMGWSKRAIDDMTKPKWLHNKEFQKSLLLFGLDELDSDSAILVEAPLSVIMLAQHGIKNAIASFGANISNEQAAILRARCNSLLVFYDPDDAGRAGTRMVIDKLGKFMNVYVVGQTREDPAAQTKEENLAAIYENPVIASWAYF